MCTAITYQTRDFYFGRTLDYEMAFGETVTITPRNFRFSFRHGGELKSHYAIVGMAHVADGYPLYYDAVNENGLCMAGLNFVGNARYGNPTAEKENVAQFELIPWLLSQCETVGEVREKLCTLNVVGTPFNERYPTAELHWLVADKREAIAVESVEEGLRIYENPVGVLTNNPPFDEQLRGLELYTHLTAKDPDYIGDPRAYSRGRGAIGLPGDLSSPSRFVRAVFTKQHAVSGEGEKDSVSQFFHMLGTVEQTRGCCEVENGEYAITQYTACCNADKGVYYYTTYGNRRVTAVNMHHEELEGSRLISYPLINSEDIKRQN